MYKVLIPGKTVYIDELRFVRMNPSSGAYIQCPEYEAEALAVMGNLYSLPDKPPVIVTVVEQIDDDHFVESTQPAPIAQIITNGDQEYVSDLQSVNDSLSSQTTHLQLALLEVNENM